MSQPAGSSDNKPVVICVEDYCTDNDEHFNYLRYVGNIIESCGFRMVHAENHDVLPQVLEQHPDAVGIVSDVDTTKRQGDGIRWAETYLKNKDSKPFVLVSIIPQYQDDANGLGVPFIRKPLLCADGTSLVDDKDEREFEEALTKWLQKLMSSLGEGCTLPSTHAKFGQRNTQSRLPER
jgi:hypothetical protein